ncbi:glycosyl hydrolase catalytic core-domain-containing protein [Naematelia encephala]|uniref:Glycosyl hydrolase catalytic core-domain-containing protein n=1 Tax=Naematelia encephala TaxID=71784 RepID=A0A1Y2BJ38_9TREE|nr:glycosyl hydrolase catalytic core-domain-containing protein [Naematelia encephala]
MQLSALALLSLLPLLATATHSAPRSAPRHAAHRRISEVVERREALAAEHPPAVERKRVVKKRSGASGCRPKSSLTYSPSSTVASSTSTSSGVTSVSTTATSTASTTDAATTSAATTSDVAGEAAAWWSPASSSSSDDDWSQSSTTSSSSTAAAATSSAASSSGSSGSGSLTPKSIKAGLSGTEALEACGDHISWVYDWGVDGSGSNSATYIPMLWGDGNSGMSDDWSRLEAFKSLTDSPDYILGFYEPDCSPPMSSDIDPTVAAPLWNSLIVPHRTNGGSLLLSPGMCKQKDETWLTPFKNAIGDDNMWDITAIHINKNNLDGVKEDINHYWNTYGKPIWVSEFACVDDSNGFVPSTDQTEINQFINEIVPYLESDSRVYAYAYSNGAGLGSVWPMWVDGQLTESGQTYINAISAYH